MATCAELAAQLTALQAARTDYLLGKKTRVIASGSKQIQREPFNIAAVDREINRLQTKVDACNGTRTARHVTTIVPRDSNSQEPFC